MNTGEVARPRKKSEYLITCETSNAGKGWRDLLATQRSAVVDAWDFLTRTPKQASDKCHQLKGDLGTVTHNGATHERWQLELSNGARIWYYVTQAPKGKAKFAGTVHLLNVHTHHPNQTK